MLRFVRETPAMTSFTFVVLSNVTENVPVTGSTGMPGNPAAEKLALSVISAACAEPTLIPTTRTTKLRQRAIRMVPLLLRTRSPYIAEVETTVQRDRSHRPLVAAGADR